MDTETITNQIDVFETANEAISDVKAFIGYDLSESLRDHLKVEQSQLESLKEKRSNIIEKIEFLKEEKSKLTSDETIAESEAIKKANELMAYTYSHLYDIPTTGLRFFTVYGPWGRPDMAYFKFTNLIKQGKQIDIYNNGEMYRDFTYIDDIVESIKKLIPIAPEGEVPSELFNIGYGSPVKLLEFVEILEKHLGVVAKKNFMPMQPGDVPRTWADTADLKKKINYKPRVSLDEGIKEFVAWYKNYI
jgi:UDP-glucuronate 4-epimerase